MRRIFNFAIAAVTGIAFMACSSDDAPYNPYDHRDKESFYPSEIIINKESRNRDIDETWSFEYAKSRKNRISKYTHTITTTRTDNNTTEITTETEEGALSYPNENIIQNIIDYTKTVEGGDRRQVERETITERVTCDEGRVSMIERIIDYKDENGNTTSSATTTRSFTYTGDHCTSSTYTDENGKQSTIYTYRWDSSHKLNSVVVDDKTDERRISRTYNYAYGPVSTDYGFEINAFLYDNMPHIYAAMGMFGKSAPYVIDEEEQDFRELFDGKWEEISTSDTKVFTPQKYSDEIEIDIYSNIYRNNYNIRFIKR